MRDTDLFAINRNQKTYKEQKQYLIDNLEDDDLMLVGRNNNTYITTGAEFKGIIDGEIVEAPTITSSSTYAPSTLTATAAVENAEKEETSYDNWYKDGVAIGGTAEQLVYSASTGGTYKYEEKWIGLSGNATYTSSEIVVFTPTITKPTIIAPANGAGISDPNTAPSASNLEFVSSTPASSGTVNVWG